MRAVSYEGAGGNEVVRVVTRDDPVPGPGEVLVAARFAGVNPADLLQREGRYPPPPGAPEDVPGLEVAGTVLACGPDATRFAPGQRVMGLVAGGGLADRVVVDQGALVAVPDTLDDTAAAAVPEAYITAHDALVTQGRLSAGGRAVVQGVTGGVGGAAAQIGVALGATVLGVHRDPAAFEDVAATGAVPVLRADLLETVRRLPSGPGRTVGVDVVVELVGAPNIADDLAILATGGRIVVVGVGAGARVELSLLDLMVRRGALIGTVLRSRDRAQRAAAVAAFADDVLPLLASGRIVPRIEQVLPVDRVTDALDLLATPGRRGKVLVSFD
jgi:NADPH:quinone reductase-like Zn-dependent oxidoreductase